MAGCAGAKVILALIFAAFFVLCWANLFIADRIAPPYRLAGPEDELLERYHDLVAERTGCAGHRGRRAGAHRRLRRVVRVELVAPVHQRRRLRREGPAVPPRRRVLRVQAAVPVVVVDWLFASLLIILIVVTVAHYLNGGIRVQPPSPRVAPQVKAHLSVLVAALALVKAADYWLQRFELTVSSRGGRRHLHRRRPSSRP